MVSLLCGLSRICVSRLTKGLVTHVTFVWFFSCVDYHVSVCPAETNLPDLSDLQAAVSDFQLYLPPAPPSDSDLLLPAQQWQLSAYQSAIVDESDRTEDNRLTLQHTCAQSQKRIMSVCFVNDTVFLVQSDSSTIESYHDGVFTGSLTVPLRTGWLSGIAALAAHNCLYVGASQSTQLHRVDLASDSRMVWYMPKWPPGLSVTASYHHFMFCIN